MNSAVDPGEPPVGDLSDVFDAIFLRHALPDQRDISVSGCLDMLKGSYRFVRVRGVTADPADLSFLAPSFLEALRKGHHAFGRATLGADTGAPETLSVRTRAISAAIARGYGVILSPFTGQLESVHNSLGREWYLHVVGEEFCLVSQMGSISVMVDLETVWVFPQRNLILSIENGLTEAAILQEVAETFVRCVTHAVPLVGYLERGSEARTLALTDLSCPHMSHNLWNVQTGWANVLAAIDADRIGAFLLYTEQNFFGDLTELFPDSVPNSDRIISVRNDDALFLETLKNNLLTFTVKDEFFPADFTRRLLERAYRMCSPQFLQEVQRLRRQTHPLVVTTIRLDNRAWIEQREGMPALFNKLHEQFPRLGLVMDGLSSDTPKGWSTYWMSMASELEMACSIRAELPPGMPVMFGVGQKFAETLVLLSVCDLFIAPSGSGMALYKWLFNMPGVAFSNRSVLDEKSPERWPLRVWHDRRFRSDLVPTVHLSHELVTDGEVARKHLTRSNFHLDWMEIYQASVPLIEKVLESPGSAAAEPTEVTGQLMEFARTAWRFTRGDQLLIASKLQFQLGGKIEFSLYSNERYWSVRNGNVCFLNPKGEVTTEFTRLERGADGMRVLEGPFLLDPKVTHVLTELPRHNRAVIPATAPRVAVLVRTHIESEKIEDLLSILSDSECFDLFVCADCTKSDLTFNAVPVLRHRVTDANKLGLPANRSDLMWYCGDYAFYFAYTEIPDYDYYIMVEYDVDFPDRTPLLIEGIINRLKFGEQAALDFVGCQMKRGYFEEGWGRTVSGIYPEPLLCLFPFVVLSRRAIEYLIAERQAERKAQHTREHLMFCEAFVPSALHAGGFQRADINNVIPHAIEDSTFRIASAGNRGPMLLRQYSNLPHTIKLVHPVYDERKYLEYHLQKARQTQDKNWLATLISPDSPFTLSKESRDLIKRYLNG